ncbi:MAG TPA: DUF2249 domain-containing protein [Dehalococcoidales bacterium]|nr:DUF2249 domain-containing protein [Dehalococcoidales bacterium]
MSWGCPHQLNDDTCRRLKRECHPGTRGCVLNGRFVFAGQNEEVNNMAKVEDLDIRSIVPPRRHELIMEKWQALPPGDTLRITNDHDPRPLRYQFEAEYKGKFAWQYEQQGPQDWIVAIKKVS